MELTNSLQYSKIDIKKDCRIILIKIRNWLSIANIGKPLYSNILRYAYRMIV